MKRYRMRGGASYILALLGLSLLLLHSNVAYSEPFSPAAAAVAKPREIRTDKFAEALRYEHGEGVALDYSAALKLYCQAVDEGDSRPFYNLGWMFFNARGVPRDNVIAASWFRKAAGRGVQQAATLLQMMGSVASADRTGCPPPPPPADGNAAQAVLPGAPLTPPAEVRSIVEKIAGKYGLDVTFVYAVIAAESGFDPLAISNRHAMGLMQLLPETAVRFGVKDIFNPAENIRGGVTYLRWLIKRFSGNLDLVLAAYNAGEGNVDNFRGVPPFAETINYIARIKRYYPYQAKANP